MLLTQKSSKRTKICLVQELTDHYKLLQATPHLLLKVMDEQQPSTSDMPDAEELMETTQAPSTMAEQLSG